MAKKWPTLLACLAGFAVLAAVSRSTEKEQAEEARAEATAGTASAHWWKGNLHTHSLWSDGDDFPEMIADWYRDRDYHFLALTDHNVLSRGERWLDLSPARKKALDKYLKRFGPDWVELRKNKDKEQVRLKTLTEFAKVLDRPGKFLLVQGEEITHRFAKLPVHVNAINLRDVIKPADGKDVTETIQVQHRLVAEQRRKAKQPMFAFLNHPNFGYAIRAEDMVPAEELRYFEVYNGHPGVKNEGDAVHPSTERMWDIVLALRLGKHRLPPILGLATDDAHRYHEYGVGKVNPGRGWIMVKAPSLAADALVNAIEAGDFYASTGVLFDEIERRGDVLRLRIQARPTVGYRTEWIATFKGTPLDGTPPDAKDGKTPHITGTYSKDIGRVVAVSQGAEPTYRLTGKELYVRARVISDRRHPNPYRKGDVEMAWTQPVIP